VQGLRVNLFNFKNSFCHYYKVLIFIFSLGLLSCGGGSSGELPSTPSPDKAGPVILGISPTLNEIDVIATGTRITVVFDEPLNEKLFFTINVVIEELNNAGEVIPGTELALDSIRPFSYQQKTNTLTIRPTAGGLKPQKNYQITLQDFEDMVGNIMVVYKSAFSTSKSPTATINPVDGSVPVSRGDVITVEFSEVMDEASLKSGFILTETLPNATSDTVYKFTDNNSVLSLNHLIVDNKSIATYSLINPSTQAIKLFAPSTTYKVNLSPTITEFAADLKGNPLAALSSSFTTGVSDQTGTPPAAPGIVTVVSEVEPQSASIFMNTINWPTEIAKGYNLYVSINGGSFTQIAATVSPLTQSGFIHIPVSLGTRYIYAVTAMDLVNNQYGPESTFSLSTVVIPSAPLPTTLTAIAGPTTNVADGLVKLTWDTVTGISYNLYVSTNRAQFLILSSNMLATGAQLQYSYTPAIDTIYSYAVTLINSNGTESSRKVSVEIVPFGAPANVTTLAGDKQITVTWPQWVNVPGLSYDVSVKIGAAATFIPISTGNTIGSFIHGNGLVGSANPPLVSGETYIYRVNAISKVGSDVRISSSKDSVAQTLLAPPVAPTILSTTAGDGIIDIKWATVANTNEYRIYEKNVNTNNFTFIKSQIETTIKLLASNNISHSYQISAVSNNVEGLPATTTSVKPMLSGAKLSAWNHSCAITVGALWCWGDNKYGQLGIGKTSHSEKQTEVSTPLIGRIGSSWIAVATGTNHTCGIRNTGEMYCWGDGRYGGLGNTSGVSTNVPTIVSKPLALGAINVNWIKVEANDFSTCAIHSTATVIGQLYCWGNNYQNILAVTGTAATQTKVFNPEIVLHGVDLTDNWIEIDLGSEHICGLRQVSNGTTAWCWGARRRAATGDNPTDKVTARLLEPTQVVSTVGAVLPDTDWASLATGKYHTCGVRGNSNSLWCWGANILGQIGNKAPTLGNGFYYAPIRESTGASDWIKVFANNQQTCGLKKSGAISCWGDGAYGKAGNGDIFAGFSPTPFLGTSDWSDIATGIDHTCARHLQNSISPGGVACWGNADRYKLGTSSSSSPVPKQVGIDTDWYDIVANTTNHFFGGATTVALKGSALTHGLYSWGNEKFKLYNTGDFYKQQPILISNIYTWKEINSGNFNVCGIQSDNSLWCWGQNLLSTKPVSQDPRPVKISTDSWLHVDPGFSHSCAIKSDSSLWCWGDGRVGQLGGGDNATTSTPNVPVKGLMIQVVNPKTTPTTWVSVSAGYDVSCAIDNINDLYCWGYNFNGQLGIGVDGTGANGVPSTSIPKLVTKPTGVTKWLAISVGSRVTCGLTDNGNQNLYCWGSNSAGTIGSLTASVTNQSSPIAVDSVASITSASRPWLEVDVTDGHTCARKNDSSSGISSEGSLWCWGYNNEGQMGNGTIDLDVVNSRATNSVPKQINAGIFWKKFSAGIEYNCAIKSDRTLWCWGTNRVGQLGTNNAWSLEPKPLTFP